MKLLSFVTIQPTTGKEVILRKGNKVDKSITKINFAIMTAHGRKRYPQNTKR
jgi:hypothetical protein